MSKEALLYPTEGSRCFWQAFVFAKYTGDTQDGRKRKSSNLIKWFCVKILSFLRTKSPLFLLKCDLEASWLFLFLVIKKYIVDGEEKKKKKEGKAEFLHRFFVQDLCLWNKTSFSSTFLIGQLQFLGATVSLWMENATLNYGEITTLLAKSTS